MAWLNRLFDVEDFDQVEIGQLDEFSKLIGELRGEIREMEIRLSAYIRHRRDGSKGEIIAIREQYLRSLESVRKKLLEGLKMEQSMEGVGKRALSDEEKKIKALDHPKITLRYRSIVIGETILIGSASNNHIKVETSKNTTVSINRNLSLTLITNYGPEEVYIILGGRRTKIPAKHDVKISSSVEGLSLFIVSAYSCLLKVTFGNG